MEIICFGVIAPTFSSYISQTLEREAHLFGHILGCAKSKFVGNTNEI